MPQLGRWASPSPRVNSSSGKWQKRLRLRLHWHRNSVGFLRCTARCVAQILPLLEAVEFKGTPIPDNTANNLIQQAQNLQVRILPGQCRETPPRVTARPGLRRTNEWSRDCRVPGLSSLPERSRRGQWSDYRLRNEARGTSGALRSDQIRLHRLSSLPDSQSLAHNRHLCTVRARVAAARTRQDVSDRRVAEPIAVIG
jgi:hypothetical protein